MRFLIAGLGSIGRRHFRNLISLGENDIVLLRTHRATLPDDELAGYPIETDLGSALEEYRPDAVVVSNPTALHLDIAVPAADAGCAVLLEKPISHSMDRIDVLQSAVRNNQAGLLVGFQFRFHPALQRTKQLIADGELGRVISANVHFGEYLPAWHPWEDYRKGYAARVDLGGGVVLTQCHSLDYLPWLVGKVDSVWGFAAKLSDLDVEVEDTAEVGLRFESGALGSIHLDYCQQPPMHRLEIIGTKGSLQCDFSDGAVRVYRADKMQWDVFSLPTEWERNVMFLEQMKHFVSVVQKKEAPVCTLEDGVSALRLALSVLQSAKSGQKLHV